MSMPPTGQTSGAPAPSGRRISPRIVGLSAIALVTVIFIVENTQRVPIRFLIPKFTAPLWLALALAFALGAVFGMFVSWRRGRRD